MFEEMGWTVSETCSGSADIAVSELAAANDGPTLLGTPTQLSASITSGSNVTYTWDFGDSTGGSGASTSHTYPEAGEYTARVTATNAVSEETATTLVTVEESISGLIAANNGPTLIGETTEMSASLVSGSNVTYEWDFGDGETGSGAMVSHLYTSPGIYDVEVTATNLVSQETAQTVVYVVEQVYRIFLPLNSKQP
jgi:PKD repeat protein